MSGLLDRAFQRKILEKLSSVYPNVPNLGALFGSEWDENNDLFTINLHYLDAHDLVRAVFSKPMRGPVSVVSAKITAKGLDFLADDGGLSAILGTVTVRLHDDTVRQILIQRIEAAEGDTSVKQHLVAKIKTLPAEALGKLTLSGLDKALASSPNLLTLLSDLIL